MFRSQHCILLDRLPGLGRHCGSAALSHHVLQNIHVGLLLATSAVSTVNISTVGVLVLFYHVPITKTSHDAIKLPLRS